MADWVSKANYNNPLFTIYHTLQFAKHKGMYWGRKKKFTDYYGHECENTFGMPLVHHRAELAPGLLKCFATLCHIAKFCLHVLSHRHVLSPRTEKCVTLFQQHCNTAFLFPRCMYRCALMHSRAVLRCFIIPASDKD